MANQKPQTAFVLSMLGGIFIVGSAALRLAIRAFFRSYGMYIGMYTGMHVMGGFGFGFGFLRSIIALMFGIIVIVSALMLYRRPQRHGLCGILVIIFSVFSGGIIGALLGLVGGILAIIWKPPAT
ncbi:MAG: hypothetical protein ACLPY5_08505 [Candidatus Bathyarchaeia archaeon]